MKSAIWLLPLTLVMHSSHAELYKWIDKDGSIIYSDTPPYEGAKQLVPPGLTTTPAVKVEKKKPTTPTSSDDSDDFKYTGFRIISPKHDQAIRDNQGNIAISLAITPSINLKKGHYVTMTLDGKDIEEKFISASITLKNIDRGSHTLSATLKNKTGQILMSSKPITLHLHRFSTLHNKAN